MSDGFHTQQRMPTGDHELAIELEETDGDRANLSIVWRRVIRGQAPEQRITIEVHAPGHIEMLEQNLPRILKTVRERWETQLEGAGEPADAG